MSDRLTSPCQRVEVEPSPGGIGVGVDVDGRGRHGDLVGCGTGATENVFNLVVGVRVRHQRVLVRRRPRGALLPPGLAGLVADLGAAANRTGFGGAVGRRRAAEVTAANGGKHVGGAHVVSAPSGATQPLSHISRLKCHTLVYIVHKYVNIKLFVALLEVVDFVWAKKSFTKHCRENSVLKTKYLNDVNICACKSESRHKHREYLAKDEKKENLKRRNTL